MINQEKITKRLYKALNLYSTRVEMLNDMHHMGISRHECMIIEMLLLGKDYESIKRILLFTDASFSTLIENLYVTLKGFKKRKVLYDKIKG